MKLSRILIAACFCASTFMTTQAAGNIWADVTPKDWAYQALQTLVNHGAIEDTKGINLSGQTYTRYELTPLVAYVVEKRESMNETDKNLAIRLYSEWREELMAYNREQEIREKGHTDDELDRKPLTEAEIAEKMENFTIDDRRMFAGNDRRVAFGGDVRLRTSNRDRADYRTRIGVVISSSGTAAPDELYDKIGKLEIKKTDEEAVKSREKFKKIKAQRDKEDAEAIAKAQKEAAKEEASKGEASKAEVAKNDASKAEIANNEVNAEEANTKDLSNGMAKDTSAV